jgi:hypothetical protein
MCVSEKFQLESRDTYSQRGYDIPLSNTSLFTKYGQVASNNIRTNTQSPTFQQSSHLSRQLS